MAPASTSTPTTSQPGWTWPSVWRALRAPAICGRTRYSTTIAPTSTVAARRRRFRPVPVRPPSGCVTQYLSASDGGRRDLERSVADEALDVVVAHLEQVAADLACVLTDQRGWRDHGRQHAAAIEPG